MNKISLHPKLQTSMILVFTGKNQDEAFAPLNQFTETWRYLKPRYPQNLGFENALRQSCNINGITLPNKLYFSIVNHQLIIDRLSAKLQIWEVLTAFDASVIDHFDNDDDVQDRLNHLWEERNRLWDSLSGDDGLLFSSQANFVRRHYKASAERLWTELFTELFSEINLWDEES